ncbi:ribosomal L7Ae/L30e/S12e/Gadd45 family protein [Candidatus Woesearchaeota archaeon]|nr:ribosomal L7Ae/L30e/S12e/Gadd45 family protein [Candidatus Woesearchaeota archaeon]
MRGSFLAPEDIMVNADKALEAIEVARTTGKLRKGSNEVTKAIERGQAKLVVVAQDVTPKEIVMHIPLLSKEKGVLCIEVPSKDNLGASAGLEVGTAAVVIVQEGDAKKIIEELKKAG